MGCDEDVGRILIIIRNMGKRRIKNVEGADHTNRERETRKPFTDF